MKGFGFYVGIFVIVAFAVWFSGVIPAGTEQPYTYNDFQDDITKKQEDITAIDIYIRKL